MGLVLTRQEGENIILLLDPECDEAQVLDALRHEGIMLSVIYAQNGKARVLIEAPDEISIIREELIEG
ncbi:carbon storage regulator CsrA [Pseudomonas duriflava]|uniref:Carbon storage regulator CsrA n=1 Tax=Pseudomonas duriflava TaxID=459528 RepID=A0A562PZN8_9PSED|nr:carbon storage regulator [Pseudomonas duriflava]TWI49650.1 carbon storage regulator CsrA [Pseudomonas duriflava]